MTPPRDGPSSAAGLALAAVGLAVASGAVLVFFYDPRAPADSLLLVELARPAPRIARAVHAWSSTLAIAFTLVHAAERRARVARVIAGGLVLLLVAASGVLLRGDAEGLLARVAGYRLLAGVPLAADALLGPTDDLRLSLMHHAAVLTLAAAVLVVRRRDFRIRALVFASALVLALAWAAPPGLAAGLEPVTADRWLAAALVAAAFVAIALAAWLPEAWRRRVAAIVAVAGAAWAAAILVPRPPRLASATSRPLLRPLSLERLEAAPVVRGQREGCPVCHASARDLAPSHDPAALGCAVCHLGDPARPDADGAHAGMLRVPGNLDSVERTCGRAGCHDAIAARVVRTLMTTAVGLVAVDRFVFGEQAAPDGTTAIDELDRLGGSPADRHLGQLCATCHLSHEKEVPGPTTEASRGGGCVACHLVETGQRPDHHPAMTVHVRDEACFGCHSRSGRIALGYAGWLEAAGGERTLSDGRSLRRAAADVHHDKGLACIDCHTSQELMGDGRDHTHEEQATHVRCTTCHRVAPAKSVALASAGQEAAVIATLRGPPPAELLVEDRSGEPLTNARPSPGGDVAITGKLDGKLHTATPPARACTALVGHERLSCQACHSAWVPRCSGCHTQLDAATKDWVEYDVPAEAGPPTLGLRERDGRVTIEPFVPGMILTLNGPSAPRPPDPLPSSAAPLIGPGTRFVRAYALAVPHTTTRAGRSCISCHLDPVALGYGKGRLSIVDKDGSPAWRFDAAYAPAIQDGLPGDAWIGFLRDPTGAVATRREARPLGLEEQRRLLAAGACMTCHDPGGPIFTDYEGSTLRKTASCRVPGWH